jgi:hypothetical protein
MTRVATVKPVENLMLWASCDRRSGRRKMCRVEMVNEKCDEG